MSIDLINLLVLLTAMGDTDSLEKIARAYTPGKVVKEAGTLPGQMEEAFNSIGLSMMENDFACKLLAYVSVIGSEACVLHKGLNAGIMIAQQKLNLYGGQIPNVEILPLLQKRIKELSTAFHKKRSGEFTEDDCPWVWEIHNKYDLSFRPNKKATKNTERL